MKTAVLVFPASNCDRDAQVALRELTGREPSMVWHGETELPETDLIVVPGGFSYGDYLRCGAVAARSPIMGEVKKKAEGGTPVVGICNGFQILIEAGMLPGALMRNAGLDFVCRPVTLRAETTESRFTRALGDDPYLTVPVAHHDGNYFADDETLDRLEGEGRVAFRYLDNPNGSARDIAGIVNDAGNVLGLMPHPERAISKAHGSEDGARFWRGVLAGA